MNPEIDISNAVLKTERLLIRPWRESDLDDLYSYASVDGVGQMAGWKPHESKEESKMILDMFIRHKKTFALEYQGKVIGSVGIEKYNEAHFPEFENQKCREIGYALSKDYWGRGLMPEAVKEVIRFLFEDADLDVVFCGRFLRNERSHRVQEKCGFRHYAYDTYETMIDTIEDNEVNIITKEDWKLSSIIKRGTTVSNNTEKAALMRAAINARENAYAPYSGFSVGAAVECDDGSVYTGCNVENASYPCGICAERTAVSKAVSEGRRKFRAIAVSGSSPEKCTPCGICRQFLFEFAPDMTVLCGDKDGAYDETALAELLPRGFGAASMK